MSEGTWQYEKTEGNTDYTAGRTESALQHYSKALEFADLPPADRATILSNRAQVYLRLNKFAEAVEDCTTCLTLSPDNVKALFRRAAAFEGLGQKKDALADYRTVVAKSPGVGDALNAVKRLEKELGITRKTGGGDGGMGRLTAEDAKQFEEVKQRVKDVALQKARAKDQQLTTQREKRSLELSLGQVEKLPEDVRTFRPVGKMFLLTPRPDLRSVMTDKLTKTDHKLKICQSALEHIERQEKEADGAFTEMLAEIRKKYSA